MHKQPSPIAVWPDHKPLNRCHLARIKSPSLKQQHGAIALFFAVIIMLAVTLTVIFTARTAAMEQRMSANEVRTSQAANAAQAGLDALLTHIQTSGVTNPLLSSNGAVLYRARLWDPEAALPPQCPENPASLATTNQPTNTQNVLLYSCGWSDDLSARRIALMQAKSTPSLAVPNTGPTHPLISRGGVNTFGAARVYNYFEDNTIWTGDVLTVTGNPGTTFVRNVDNFPNYPDPTDALPEPPANCVVGPDYICGTDASFATHDVLGDLALGSLTPDEFFRNFMGLERH